MRKKVSWTGWRKQLKQYVTSVSKMRAADVNGENGKEENEVNGDKHHRRHDVGDLGTEPLSSCEGLKSDNAIQREEKPQIGIESDARQLAVSHLSPLRSLRPNSGPAPQTSPPPSNFAAATHGSVLKKVSFKHVYRSGPVRKVSSRTRSGANNLGAQRPEVLTRSGEPETVAATRIQAAFRGYRSRRNSSEDVWSEEKELSKTQASSMSQIDPHRNLQTPGASDLNINGAWDADTRSPADLEAIVQFKQEAILKRERQREYALSLRRLRYGLEQKSARGLPADDKMLDKPGYVLNWLERAQGSRDNRVLKNVTTDATNLPSESLVPDKGIADGEKRKSRGEKLKNGDRLKPKNDDKEEPNAGQRDVTETRTPTGTAGNARDRGSSDVEQLQNHLSPTTVKSRGPNQATRRTSLGNVGTTAGKKVTTMNDRRKSYGGSSATATSASTAAILQSADRNVSSPFAGMMKAPILSATPKKLPFKI